jgi:hypothetical protein
MDGAAIGLGLLVVGAVAAFVTWPWWTKHGALQLEAGSTARSGAESLGERHEAVLIALRDLDFDHAVGKVFEGDYESLRQALLVEAADIVTQLDEARATDQADLDARIESEVLAVRQELNADLSNNACPSYGRAARSGDVYCASCGAQLNVTCPTCRRLARPADLFCTGCGAELALAVS